MGSSTPVRIFRVHPNTSSHETTMDDGFELLIDLYKPNARLGPGGDAQTRKALAMSGLLGRQGLKVADLGCGTGASTLVLAQDLDAHVTAVDLFPEFLDELTRRARERGVHDRVTTLAASIDALPFDPGSLDAIWSEGAIYNLGFEAGIASWRPLLAPGGVLAVSELTWLTHARTAELQAHWDAEYPQVATASEKIAILERHGFTPLGYFPLPESSWIDHYYAPLRARFPDLLAQHDHSEAARALVTDQEREIDLYERYKEYMSYGFYIARTR